MNTYTVPISMLQQMINRLPQQRAFALTCAQRVGVSSLMLDQPFARITVEQYSSFYRSLVIGLDDETPGFFSRKLKGGTLKFLCLSMLSAANLQTALYRFCWFFRLLIYDITFKLKESDSELTLQVVENVDLAAERVLIIELMLLLVQGVACWMVDRRLVFNAVNLAYAAPKHHAEYLNMFTGTVNFQQAENSLVFKKEDLGLHLHRDNKALSAFLRKAPQYWIRPVVSDLLYTHKVRELLHQNIAYSLKQVASILHLSSRTLARRLDTEGSHFQGIKSNLRRDIAIHKLLRTNSSITNIGLDLGFNDPAVFNRAFKLWAGLTPGIYRKGMNQFLL